MGKMLRNIFIALFILIVVLIGGAIWFLKTVDINKFKPYLVNELSVALGRDVKIDRIKLNLSFLGTSVVHLYGIEIGELPPLQKETFATAAHVQAEVNLADLLSQLKSWQKSEQGENAAQPASSENEFKPSLVKSLKA
ncbi:MAG: AsmA family protein, partial [Candidatus Omnitrophica bacterium]|nr:AsmA family protein [Candidatus Omnitrophota bacterium]